MMSLPSISPLTAGMSFNARTQAFTKKPMKPSFTPCVFSNRSLYWLRRCITALMSTSLKVVSMAAVFCASLSRRAMVARSRVIFTRSSRAASSGTEGARTCTAAAGCATGVGAAAARSIAASMSPLVTRPSLPVPATLAASMPLSAASRRTEGAVGVSAEAIGVGAAAGFGAGAGCGGGAGFAAAGAAAALDAAAPAPSLIWPSRAPTATVSPSLAAMSLSTPAAGAGTSIVTLSVSSSTSGSSTATGSPGFLNHLPIVASVTDSPSVGTRISVMVSILGSRHAGLSRHFCAACKKDVDGRGRPGHDECGLSQRLFQQLLELGEVLRHQAGGGRGRGRPARIARVPVLVADLLQHPADEGVDEEPRAHVARLLLAPDDRGLLEAGELGHQRLGRERIELLDAQEVDVVDAALLALLVEVEVDLAGAQHDAADLRIRDELDLLARQELRVVPQESMERGAGIHLGEARDRALVAQQALRRHQDQRLPDLALELAAQDMKQVGGGRAVRDLHIVLRAHLQEALEPRRGMLRTLALVAVRQHADQARHAQPLAL